MGYSTKCLIVRLSYTLKVCNSKTYSRKSILDEMLAIKGFQACKLPHREDRGRKRRKRGLTMVHNLRAINLAM